MDENPYQSPQTETAHPAASFDPPENIGPRGLTGWLLLVGLGVTLSPINLLWDLSRSYLPIFTEGYFSDYTDPASSNYTPYYAATFLIEVLANVAMFFLTLWVAYLFFSKHPLFPKVYIFRLLAYPVLTVFYVCLRTWPYPDEPAFTAETIKYVVQTCVPAAIWIPYTLRSQRVRNTFTRQARG